MMRYRSIVERHPNGRPRVATRLALSGALVFGAAAGVGVLTLSSGAGATTAAPRLSLMRQNGASTVVSQHRLSGGQAVVVLRQGDVTSTFAGPIGSTLSTTHTSHEAEASVTSPNTKTAGHVKFESARTVYEDALAVGFTKTEALNILRSAHVSLSQVVPDSILASPCANVSGGGGSSKSCTVETGIQTPANGDWYLGNQISTTGQDDGFSELDILSGWTSYPSGNTTVEWNPQSYTSEGNCKTVTWSLGFDGIGISESGSVCPSAEEPTSGDNGGKWFGCDGAPEGAPAVNVDHSPAGTSDAVTANVKMGWALGC